MMIQRGRASDAGRARGTTVTAVMVTMILWYCADIGVYPISGPVYPISVNADIGKRRYRKTPISVYSDMMPISAYADIGFYPISGISDIG